MVQREQLEEERELLAAIVDQVNEGVVMADKAGVLRLLNRAARELGMRSGVAIPEEALLTRALRGERSSKLVQYRAPGGTMRALDCVALPVAHHVPRRASAVDLHPLALAAFLAQRRAQARGGGADEIDGALDR
jgi:hypothetical protein